MLLRSVDYARPDTVADAISALGSNPNARPLAGGQSLINVLKHRLAAPDLLVDISDLNELRFIDVADDGSATIGAGVTYDELEHSDALRGTHPKLSEVAATTVDQQVRCRGTIGGNACYNDPSSNFPPLLVALQATMRIESAQGARAVPAEEFFYGPFDTAVGQGELLHSIDLPPLGDRGVGYSSILIAEDSWALARACVVLSANGTIEQARVVLGCVAPAPRRATGVEERLEGAEATPDVVRAAAPAASENLDPVSDVHASAEYRREMAAVVTSRALLEAIPIPT